MTVLVTWNIQYGKGVDGRVDLARIVATAQAAGPVDVFCFQEVADNFADMGGGAEIEQSREIARLLPGYEPVFGAGVDALGPDGRRRRFGNAILSKGKVLARAVYLLPRPADPLVAHMPRAAAVATVETPSGRLRVVSTHLEFRSANQRTAQAGRLRGLYAEAAGNDRAPPLAGTGPYESAPAAIGTVVCGDFNFTPSDPPYDAMLRPFAEGVPPLLDAWRTLKGDSPHAPTCGVYDRAQWPKGPIACDFFFVSAELGPQLRDIAVDGATQASDHQPVRLVID